MMRRHAYIYGCLTQAALVLATTLVLRADDPAPDPGAPERGVARISVVNGEVSVRRGDSGDWVAAALNAPVMVEDRLSTGAGSRAEIQFDSANMLRVGAHAEVRLAQLDPGRFNVQVAHGTITFRVLRESRAQVEISTPTVSVRPLGIGVYRVYVQEDGQTEITVRLGHAEVYTPKGSEQLQEGQTMLARGTPADPEFRIVPAIALDDWDNWNAQRDQELQNSQSYQYVPQDVYGAEDLDNNGRWVNDGTYGQVWTPTVDPGWAPYENGQWTWEDYYGWTWVSYDSWGWAPFHYGRWFHSPTWGWCWYPGGFGSHYWSPGLVAFFGFGPGIGVSFGFGNVGWVALAPFEPLYAWWGHGFYAGYRNPAYLNRGVNLANVNITNIYRNARVPNGVSAVATGDFHAGRFGNITHATGAQIREAGLVRGQLPVSPSAASLRFSNRTVAGIPRSSENIHFFAHNAPAAVQRVPFADQQRAMQQISRQPASISTHASTGTWRSVSPSAPAANPGVRATGPATAPPGGWRPVTQPPPAAPARNETYSGWQRFGSPRPYTPAPGYRPYTAPQGQPQSVRVAPQVVRPKPATKTTSKTAPRASAPAHVSGGGGGHHR